MLRRLTIDNFKSLLNVTYEPGALNLVIGENNSGKTNLCQAIRFLTLMTSLPVTEAAAHATGETWNISNVYFTKPTIDFKCTCELLIENEPLTFDYSLSIQVDELVSGTPAIVLSKTLIVQSEVLTVSGTQVAPTTLLKNDAGKVTILNELFMKSSDERGLGEVIVGQLLPRFIETTCPVERTALSQLYELKTNMRTNAFKQYLGSWLYYDLDVLQLRKPDAKPFDFVLNPDGSNLASVLYSQNNMNPRLLRRLVEIAHLLEPKLDWINFISQYRALVYGGSSLLSK